MKRRYMNRLAIPLAVVLYVTTVLPIEAQQPPKIETSLAAKAAVALTQSESVVLSGVLNTWVPLPGASYRYRPTDSEMLSVSFSAECTKAGGGSLRLRIVDNGVPFEPNSGISHIFCQSPSAATHTGKWVRRVDPGLHRLQVEAYLTAGTAIIDDWTFELVIYD